MRGAGAAAHTAADGETQQSAGEWCSVDAIRNPYQNTVDAENWNVRGRPPRGVCRSRHTALLPPRPHLAKMPRLRCPPPYPLFSTAAFQREQHYAWNAVNRSLVMARFPPMITPRLFFFICAIAAGAQLCSSLLTPPLLPTPCAFHHECFSLLPLAMCTGINSCHSF